MTAYNPREDRKKHNKTQTLGELLHDMTKEVHLDETSHQFCYVDLYVDEINRRFPFNDEHKKETSDEQ